jgi:tRNA (guanosine-2'-O-)-methyltransferase
VESFPKISKITSSSASKWVESEKFNNAKECFESLRNEGFKIYASQLNENAKELYKFDLTEKVALVFGNEHRGISDEVAKLADEVFYIPMRGMIQSLNVSVATAVSLYEVQRQREEKGMYDKSELNNDELENMIDKWCTR